VLFSVLIGGTLLGLSGALIAVPVTTVLLYLAEELYLKKLDQNKSVKTAEST
jgi:predicted PurR-regulated permease PerM